MVLGTDPFDPITTDTCKVRVYGSQNAERKPIGCQMPLPCCTGLGRALQSEARLCCRETLAVSTRVVFGARAVHPFIQNNCSHKCIYKHSCSTKTMNDTSSASTMHQGNSSSDVSNVIRAAFILLSMVMEPQRTQHHQKN